MEMEEDGGQEAVENKRNIEREVKTQQVNTLYFTKDIIHFLLKTYNFC